MEIVYKSPKTRAHILRYLNKNTYNLTTCRVIMEMKAIDNISYMMYCHVLIGNNRARH